jgi:hypothetical protein
VTQGGEWLGAALALPLAMLLACVSPRLRGSMARGLVVAPLPALCAALFASGASLKLPPLLLRLGLLLDTPGAFLAGSNGTPSWYA